MICIDFSGDYIDVVVFQGTKKKLTVEMGVTLKAPSDVFTSNGNVNFAALENCLRPTLDKIAEKRVVMTFSFLPTICSVLELHKERNKQQQRIAVESQVFANISHDEYYVDYFVSENKAEDPNKQTYISYAMLKSVANESYEMIARLNKIPLALVPSQFASQCFIESFYEDKTVALARMGSKNITLHLLNPPGNIITRDIVINSASSSLDVLASINADSEPKTVFVQNIEKLNSYQNIKFPGKPIDKTLIFGHTANDELISFVNSSLGINCEQLPKLDDEVSNSASVYTLGAVLSLGRQEINFFNKNKPTKTPEKTYTKKANVPLIVACTIVVLNIAVAIAMLTIQMQSEQLIEDRNAELNSPQTVALMEEFGNLRLDFVAKLKSEQAFLGLENSIASIGEFSRATLNEIVAAAPTGVSVSSVSFSGNTYNLVCNGLNEQQASDYVAILTDMEIFGYVGYFGYSGTDNEVSFTVVCETK